MINKESGKIRVCIVKLSTKQTKYVNYNLDVDMLANIQSKVGVNQNGYMIKSYEIE